MSNLPNWMIDEENRAIEQVKKGTTPNAHATGAPKIKRHTKGFQIDAERAEKWDALVAKMKHSSEKKNGPELLAEALDYVFNKYAP